LILVLCIGIDYALFLYWRKPEENGLLLLGNTLSAITTILSFGLLILSSTKAVYSFGLVVFLGIVLNFFITTLFLGNIKCKNL
jgi:predicted exporter